MTIKFFQILIIIILLLIVLFLIPNPMKYLKTSKYKYLITNNLVTFITFFGPVLLILGSFFIFFQINLFDPNVQHIHTINKIKVVTEVPISPELLEFFIDLYSTIIGVTPITLIYIFLTNFLFFIVYICLYKDGTILIYKNTVILHLTQVCLNLSFLTVGYTIFTIFIELASFFFFLFLCVRHSYDEPKAQKYFICGVSASLIFLCLKLAFINTIKIIYANSNTYCREEISLLTFEQQLYIFVLVFFIIIFLRGLRLPFLNPLVSKHIYNLPASTYILFLIFSMLPFYEYVTYIVAFFPSSVKYAFGTFHTLLTYCLIFYSFFKCLIIYQPVREIQIFHNLKRRNQRILGWAYTCLLNSIYLCYISGDSYFIVIGFVILILTVLCFSFLLILSDIVFDYFDELELIESVSVPSLEIFKRKFIPSLEFKKQINNKLLQPTIKFLLYFQFGLLLVYYTKGCFLDDSIPKGFISFLIYVYQSLGFILESTEVNPINVSVISGISLLILKFIIYLFIDRYLINIYDLPCIEDYTKNFKDNIWFYYSIKFKHHNRQPLNEQRAFKKRFTITKGYSFLEKFYFNSLRKPDLNIIFIYGLIALIFLFFFFPLNICLEAQFSPYIKFLEIFSSIDD